MIDADRVARLCYERFEQLPGTGKPEPGREWTLLAAVVKVQRGDSRSAAGMEVVSMGTGTKCIGQAAMSPRGDVLNDSHAEVIARRGCIRYLMEELQKAVGGRSSAVFRPSDERGRWRLQPGVSFVFFSSHTPCGDASIIPVTDGLHPGQAQPCDPVSPVGWTDAGHRRVEDRPQGPRLCLPDGPSASRIPADPRAAGPRYHSTGLLRVKPGRGEPTLSLCCSDKLCRWGALGFQGALLSHYLQEALYFSALVVGRCPFSAEALRRAVIDRVAHVSELPSGFSLCPPVLLQSSLEFPFSQNRARLQHRPGQGRISLWSRICSVPAISWCQVTTQPLDVTANGFKHGVTRKNLNTPAARSRLCKLELFHSFLTLVRNTDHDSLPDSLR
ncbi:hypothetical protein OJAV_G00060600 [Oryzias javanicus]|uniref:tRNA-specific adenosine deaminase 1 n=1 Tax=Oryzias javanicus TaxID=123683 RepID=A0A3S2UJE9_ORYJA|nr:hypothetical protein OJAV_G00060600 [Oryzias javanicus]